MGSHDSTTTIRSIKIYLPFDHFLNIHDGNYRKSQSIVTKNIQQTYLMSALDRNHFTIVNFAINELKNRILWNSFLQRSLLSKSQVSSSS